MPHNLKRSASPVVLKLGVVLLVCASVYPIYVGITCLLQHSGEPLHLIVPLLTDGNSIKIPVKIAESGEYLLSVAASIERNEQLIKCLLSYSTESCSKYGTPLTFQWKLTSSKGDAGHGTYSDRDKYFAPFISGPDARNPIAGCEFAWISSLQSGDYMLELTNLHVPEKLKVASPRLEMKRHRSPYDFDWLNIIWGLSVSALTGFIGAVMLLVVLTRHRVRR